MALRPENLPSDPALLVELALGLDAENEALRATISNLKGLIFGTRSERMSVILAEQLALDLDERTRHPAPANDDAPHAATRETERPQRARSKRNIGALPANLPRHEVTIEPETTSCPCCAGTLHRIGEEVSEALDRTPAVVAGAAHDPPQIRMSQLRGNGRSSESASTPDRGRHGHHGARLPHRRRQIRLAVDALPQRQILAGHGVDLDRSTLARWMKRLAWS